MSMLEIEALQKREEMEEYAKEMEKRRRIEQEQKLPDFVSETKSKSEKKLKKS